MMFVPEPFGLTNEAARFCIVSSRTNCYNLSNRVNMVYTVIDQGKTLLKITRVSWRLNLSN
jgi:hypothetical protein